jgi:hypothetical protein
MSGFFKEAIMPEVDNPEMDRLKGIWPLLEEDSESAGKIEKIIQKNIKNIVHENAHNLFWKMSEYYGIQTDKYVRDLLNILARDSKAKKFHNQMVSKAAGISDNKILSQMSTEYLEFLLGELSKQTKKEEAEDSAQKYLRSLYKVGIEEVTVRLMESDAAQLDLDQTISKLNKELFESPNYYLKFSGIILPDQQEVISLLKREGIKKTFHELMKKYNEKDFQEFAKNSGLLEKKQSNFAKMRSAIRSRFTATKVK